MRSISSSGIGGSIWKRVVTTPGSACSLDRSRRSCLIHAFCLFIRHPRLAPCGYWLYFDFHFNLGVDRHWPADSNHAYGSIDGILRRPKVVERSPRPVEVSRPRTSKRPCRCWCRFRGTRLGPSTSPLSPYACLAPLHEQERNSVWCG